MGYKYIINEKGEKISIIVPIKEWKKVDAVYNKVMAKEKAEKATKHPFQKKKLSNA